MYILANAETAGEIDAHLRSWRMIIGLTSAQFSERAGITRDTLSRRENGKPGVGLDVVLSVSRALNLTGPVVASFDPLNTGLGRSRPHLLNRRRAR